MLWHCLNRRKNTESKNQKVGKTKNERIIILSKFVVRDSKNSKIYRTVGS